MVLATSDEYLTSITPHSRLEKRAIAVIRLANGSFVDNLTELNCAQCNDR